MQTIYDLTLKQMEEMLGTLGQKPYRAKQLYTWLYRKRAQSFDEMSDLPAALIAQLKERYVISPLKLVTKRWQRI